MSSKTKIVVLRMKEIIYTAIFLGLGILLVLLLFIMFRPGRDTEPEAAPSAYIPGVYSASLNLGSQEINVEVSVDATRITGISMVPLSEAVTTMYPLMQPALQSLAAQICSTQSTENLTYAEESRYTSQALIRTIERALEKARTD